LPWWLFIARNFQSARDVTIEAEQELNEVRKDHAKMRKAKKPKDEKTE
jgi:hypothetical protein